jgi:hypothetical protein
MDKKNHEDYELIKSYFDKVVLSGPAFIVSETVFI